MSSVANSSQRRANRWPNSLEPSVGRSAAAYAGAVLARSCGSTSRTRGAASAAMASSSAVAAWLDFAYAHAVLARFCAFNSRARGAASVAMAPSSSGAARLAVAYAHAVLSR